MSTHGIGLSTQPIAVRWAWRVAFSEWAAAQEINRGNPDGGWISARSTPEQIAKVHDMRRANDHLRARQLKAQWKICEVCKTQEWQALRAAHAAEGRKLAEQVNHAHTSARRALCLELGWGWGMRQDVYQICAGGRLHSMPARIHDTLSDRADELPPDALARLERAAEERDHGLRRAGRSFDEHMRNALARKIDQIKKRRDLNWAGQRTKTAPEAQKAE